jgi:hypothetical protein
MMIGKAALPLDAAAVEQLTRELLGCVRGHYHRRPTSRATAQDALNATAIVVATIITAARECGDEDGAREFFDLALEQQLAAGDSPTTLGELDDAVRS